MVRPPEDDPTHHDEKDDAPASDGPTLMAARTSRAPRSLEQRLADAAEFDNLPTHVVATPDEKLDLGESAIRVHARPRWGVDNEATVQIAEPVLAEPPVVPPVAPTLAAAPKPDVSWLNDVTRLETPPPAPVLVPVPLSAPAPGPSAPMPAWSEPTVHGVARASAEISRSTIVIRMAMGIVVAFIASMGLLSLVRRPAPVAAVSTRPAAASSSARAIPLTKPGTQPAATALATNAPSAAASAGAPGAPVAPVAPVAAPAAPVFVAGGGDDEVAAVDAVEAGDVARAARLYAALAAAHPTNDAYREAARILAEGAKDSRR